MIVPGLEMCATVAAAVAAAVVEGRYRVPRWINGRRERRSDARADPGRSEAADHGPEGPRKDRYRRRGK